jgi:hypothetical protein
MPSRIVSPTCRCWRSACWDSRAPPDHRHSSLLAARTIAVRLSSEKIFNKISVPVSLEIFPAFLRVLGAITGNILPVPSPDNLPVLRLFPPVIGRRCSDFSNQPGCTSADSERAATRRGPSKHVRRTRLPIQNLYIPIQAKCQPNWSFPKVMPCRMHARPPTPGKSEHSLRPEC